LANEKEGEIKNHVFIFSLPTVSLTSTENIAQIYEGESLTLFADAIVDTRNGGDPNFYWCAEKGRLEIDPSASDLSQVK